MTTEEPKACLPLPEEKPHYLVTLEDCISQVDAALTKVTADINQYKQALNQREREYLALNAQKEGFTALQKRFATQLKES